MTNTEAGFHVTAKPDGGRGWAVQAKGGVVSTHRFKAVAIRSAKRLAKRYAQPVTIHRKDGEVISTKSYEVKKF